MNILKIREIMTDEGIIFSFAGLVSQDILIGIVKTIKSELLSSGAKPNTVDAVFIIAIEQMQNIMSYASNKKIMENKKYSSSGICVIGFDKSKDKYFVASSNQINEKDKEKVLTKIQKINRLTKQEQRKYLRELLRSGSDSHERGAGVGFIEMAKRSTEPLHCDFKSLDNIEYVEIKVYI